MIVILNKVQKILMLAFDVHKNKGFFEEVKETDTKKIN